jgi:hypothetical protein
MDLRDFKINGISFDLFSYTNKGVIILVRYMNTSYRIKVYFYNNNELTITVDKE